MNLRLNKLKLFERLGYKPHPGQLEVHSSRAPRRVLACGVRWGKSRCAAMEAIAAAMEPREHSTGWIVAPTYDLCERCTREIFTAANEKLAHRIIKQSEHERRLVLRNLGGGTSEIRGKSADNPTSLLGEGLDWVICDEMARLRPHIWNSHISQRLVDKHGWALLLSTPRGQGQFYDLFQRGQGRDDDYASWNSPSWKNPHLDRETIDAERARLPEAVFAQEYCGEFISGSGCVFRNVRERAVGEWQEPLSGETYVAGLDLAKVEDFTVLVIMNSKCEVVFADRFNRVDWSIQVQRVLAATDRYNQARVLVDSTGAGEPVFERLLEAGIFAEPYQFTARSKSALINNAALMCEQGEITLPSPEFWPVGIDEIEGYQYSISDAGNVRSGAPAGQHDDCVMAFALAAFLAKRASRPMEIIFV